MLRGIDAAVDDTVPARRPITVRDLLTFRLGTGGLFAPPGTYPIQAALDALDLGGGPPQPAAAARSGRVDAADGQPAADVSAG